MNALVNGKCQEVCCCKKWQWFSLLIPTFFTLTSVTGVKKEFVANTRINPDKFPDVALDFEIKPPRQEQNDIVNI